VRKVDLAGVREGGGTPLAAVAMPTVAMRFRTAGLFRSRPFFCSSSVSEVGTTSSSRVGMPALAKWAATGGAHAPRAEEPPLS